MTLKVRDEEDVLEANLRFHLAQGIDFFVVTDNGSRDATPDILRAYARAGLLHLIEDPAEDFPTPRWFTDMARMAATDFGADWVISNDADEFWWPVAGGDLRLALEGVPAPYSVLNAPRPEFVGRPDGPGSFAQRLVYREALSRLQHKVAHRADPHVMVGEGGHKVSEPGDDGDDAGPVHSGRAVLRSVSGQRDSERRARFVAAPRWPVRVLHFPVRSFEQFKRRVELRLFHGNFEERGHTSDRGRRPELLRHYEEGRLPELYEHLVYDDRAVQAGLAAGELVQDTGLRDFLAACPDPLDGEPAIQAARELASTRRLAPEEAAAELAANELDMMHGLDRVERKGRRQRRQADRRLERLRRERAELADRLAQVEAERDRLAAAAGGPSDGRWGRARARATRVLRRP